MSTENLRDLHRQVFRGGKDLSLMESLSHDPHEAEAKGEYLEALREALTSRQLELLRRTCRRFERTWEWLPPEELSGGDRTSVGRGDASYVLMLRASALKATRSGRMLYDYLQEDTDIISMHKRTNL
jgi:hypothetical protein